MLPYKYHSAEAPSAAGSNLLPLRPPLLQQHAKQYNGLCTLLLTQETCWSIVLRLKWFTQPCLKFQLTVNNLMSTLNKEFIPASVTWAGEQNLWVCIVSFCFTLFSPSLLPLIQGATLKAWNEGSNGMTVVLSMEFWIQSFPTNHHHQIQPVQL